MCVRYGGSMSIPLILASKSKPRRDLLFHAGICPTIRVSHVDEPGVIAKAAVGAGVSVDDLPIATKVMVLAQAKANAVYQAYKDVAEVSTNAHGDEVTGFPLEAAQSTADSAHTDDAQTRDFSGVQFPCVDRGFAREESVQVVGRPEDIEVVSPVEGQLVGVVNDVIFKGVHFEMHVECEGREWLIHSTRACTPGETIGMRIGPNEIHIMARSEG